MTGKTWLKWDQTWPRQYWQEKYTTKNQTNQPKKPQTKTRQNKQTKNNPVLWKGAPALRSLHSQRHVPKGSQFSRLLRGGREAELLTGANLFQHSPHTALSVCLPTRGVALHQQSVIWPPLPHSTSALTGPGCQSWHQPLCVSLLLQWQKCTWILYQQIVQLSQHCTYPLNCSKSGVQLTKCHGGNNHHQSTNCQLKENI